MQFITPTQADLDAANAAQRVEDNFYCRQMLRSLVEYSGNVMALEQQKAIMQAEILSRPLEYGSQAINNLPDLGGRLKEIARSMRLTIMLLEKLGELLSGPPAAKPQAEPPADRPSQPAEPERPEAERPEPERPTPERPTREPGEPRDAQDRLEDISRFTPAEIIAEARQTLGLPDPSPAPPRTLHRGEGRDGGAAGPHSSRTGTASYPPSQSRRGPPGGTDHDPRPHRDTS